MKNAGGKYDVIIVGAGPAGTSAAIHLALAGVDVLLLEQKKFPRQKLCGEFISPECLKHFSRLGIKDEILKSGAARLRRTVFYSRKGNNVTVPSEWFGPEPALGLSRVLMDDALLKRAKFLGVTVLEETRVRDVLEASGHVVGVRATSDSAEARYSAPVTIDATGAARVLVRKVTSKDRLKRRGKPRFVAFKAHFEEAEPAADACEIYLYKGGYGGLSKINDDLSNLCFIVSTREVGRHNGDPEVLMRELVHRNVRAATTLANAKAVTPWLAVAIGDYGRRNPAPAPGLLAIGDAASFIDPFTGSGMLMALENGELVAIAVRNYFDNSSLDELTLKYRHAYAKTFTSRLRVAGLLRQAAFAPWIADLIIQLVDKNDFVRRRLADATRRDWERDFKIVSGH